MTKQEQEAFQIYKERRKKNQIIHRNIMLQEWPRMLHTENMKIKKEVVRGSEVIKNDTGKHYRFQYTVAVSYQDMLNGELRINLDPFRIADIYGITNFAQQTALKKVLCAGNRGHKDLLQDIDDIITALDRWKQMLHEDELLVKAKQSPRISEQNHTKPDTGSNGGWMCYE